VLPRSKPKSNNFAAPVANRPQKPDLMLFITVKAPHFIRFDADRDIFTGFEIIPVRILCFILFFLILYGKTRCTGG
jgi:hypothetical protein